MELSTVENDVRFLSPLGMKSRYPDCPFQWYGEKGLSFEFNGKSEGRQGYLFSVAQSDFLSLLMMQTRIFTFAFGDCILTGFFYGCKEISCIKSSFFQVIFLPFLPSVYILCMRG